MRAIPYNTKSGGYRATIAAYLRDNEATPEDGSTVSIDLGKSGGYTGTIPVMIPVEETSAFEADWVNEDMTRFPARIKAAATALKDLGHSGTFRIEASDDGIVRISGEAVLEETFGGEVTVPPDTTFKEILDGLDFDFAERLLNFCRENSTKPSINDFLKRWSFSFQARECFRSSEMRFPRSKDYVRVWLPLRSGFSRGEGLEILKQKFRSELDWTDQDGDTMEAIHPYIRTSEQCEDLIDWFSSDPDEQKERRRIIERRRPLKDYFGGSVTDINRSALARAEQPWLRDFLLGGNPTNHCNLCGKEFSNDLLVAAHIKRRTDCSDAERTDPSIGMLLCRFGCDELYERGYVIVSEGGKVALSKEPAGEAATAYMSLLEGRSCPAWGESSKNYFAWHRERHETT
jgi:hypothetical protein